MDNLSEFRASLVKLMQRQTSYFGAQRGVDLPSSVSAPLNPSGAAFEPSFESGMATGYDGSATTVPFLVGISIVGGTDIVTGS